MLEDRPADSGGQCGRRLEGIAAFREYEDGDGEVGGERDAVACPAIVSDPDADRPGGVGRVPHFERSWAATCEVGAA